jgi:hypothetical protein
LNWQLGLAQTDGPQLAIRTSLTTLV